MTRKILKAELIVSCDIEEFEDQIEDASDCGYELSGNHTATWHHRTEVIEYSQLMVLYEDKAELEPIAHERKLRVIKKA